MFPFVKTTVSALFISALLTSAPVFADIVISGTRIIYDANKKDVSVRLENKGNRPLLVQNWLDTGDDNADPSQIKVPFASTPPVSRIEPKRGQTIKIAYTSATPLSSDRESVFWFNVLEVPPKISNTPTDNNMLQLAFRTRIKLFYRPSGLQGQSFEAPTKIKWQVISQQGKAFIQANNPTPYYVSFNQISLDANGRKYSVEASMVAPFAQAEFAVKGLSNSVSTGKITYQAISDFGGMIDGSASL
ncbi:TPA: fimbrial chaperone [Escherichia coli]|uniref:fimbrial chaperone n=1 Tax=Escherichia coli TaxID=562 RepID=UPI0005A9CB14|nr:fimbrial chaperone [Escherichia coli]EIT3897949.1 fimbrial chaperone [Escherichia coli]MDA6992741.1 fimbrial chaperone [Escherichia coli]HAL9133066.1 fimbrial chaperone [Escherichia coli]HAL9281600.1 fimbrial chaperone [Escherichia coli]HAL9521278.1 fimbrial chaperone [Escherichia coli]